MSGLLAVEGDPADCRRSAQRLAALAISSERAGRKLTAYAALPDVDFGGLTGSAFRASSRLRAGEAEALATNARGLADALTELARDLDDVQILMDRARAIGLPYGFVDGDEAFPPNFMRLSGSERPEAERWAAWRRMLAVVDRARAREARAQQAWLGALVRFGQVEVGGGPTLPGLEPPVLPTYGPAGDRRPLVPPPVGPWDPDVGPHLRPEPGDPRVVPDPPTLPADRPLQPTPADPVAAPAATSSADSTAPAAGARAVPVAVRAAPQLYFEAGHADPVGAQLRSEVGHVAPTHDLEEVIHESR